VAGAEIEHPSRWRDLALAQIEERPEEAIVVLERAISASRASADPRSEGEAEHLLALIHARGSAFGDERRRLVRLHLERAESAFRRAADNRGLLDVLAMQAVDAAESGDSANARHALAKVAHVDPALAEWWSSYIAGILSEPDAAAAALRRCLATIDVLPAFREHWRRQCERKLALVTGAELDGLLGDRPYDHLLAALELEAPDSVQAAERLLAGVQAAERARLRIRSEVKQRELSAGLGPLYHAAAASAHHEGRYRDAVELLELNTSRSLCSRAAMEWLWGQSPEQTFETQRSANERVVRALIRGQPDGLRVALRRRREVGHAVEQHLVGLVPPPHPAFQPARVASVEPLLGPADAVVFFAPFGAAYVLATGQVMHAGDVPVAPVKPVACRFHQLASNPGRPVPDDELMEVGDELAALCVDPLRSSLADASRVFVIPRGLLWGVPLAALGRNPLAETHDVAYVPNLSLLSFLLTAASVRQPRRVERFLGLADPDGTLPSAGVEIASAAAHFYNSTTFVGEEIDFAAFASLLFDADIVHLACHGGFFEDFPEFSYLHVAGSEEMPTLLWAQDVVRLAMRARLVVLASCDAGTSVALPGNEYVGLPAAFMHKGATVLAPLWAVDDNSTARLMDAFYQELPGTSPAAALWRAQARVRQDPETEHPYHWCGFQLFGAP
jgi:hypothetical protein